MCLEAAYCPGFLYAGKWEPLFPSRQMGIDVQKEPVTLYGRSFTLTL